MSRLKILKILFAAIFLSFLLTSCSKEEDLMEEDELAYMMNLSEGDSSQASSDPEGEETGEDEEEGEDEDSDEGEQDENMDNEEEEDDNDGDNNEEEDDQDEEGEQDDEGEQDENMDNEEEEDDNDGDNNEEEDDQDEEGEDEDDEDEGEFKEDCFTVQFPFSFILPDGTEHTVNSEVEVESILTAYYEANPAEEADPALLYPVTIMYADGTTEVIDSEENFETAEENCEN